MDIRSFIRAQTSKIRSKFLREEQPSWADGTIVDLNTEIDQVRDLLQAARRNFNFVTDPDAIEYYIYLQKAYEVRYDMLVRRLKARHDELTEKSINL